MQLRSVAVTGILVSCLSKLILTTPIQVDSPLFNCVKSALIGEDVDSRIITPSNDTYYAASFGSILYVTPLEPQSDQSN